MKRLTKISMAMLAAVAATGCSVEVTSGDGDLDDMASGTYDLRGPEISGDCSELDVGDLEVEFELDAEARSYVPIEDDVPSDYRYDYSVRIAEVDGIAEVDLSGTESGTFEGLLFEIDYDALLDVDGTIVTGEADMTISVDGTEVCSSRYRVSGTRFPY